MSSLSERLERAGLVKGQAFTTEVRTPTSTGSSRRDFTGTVEHVATSSGFNGAVPIFERDVLKTGSPDALHGLVRDKNWGGYPYPLQASEEAAILADTAGKIIHIAIPALTDNRVRTPEARGYVHVNDEIGYGLLIERVLGRNPKFNDGGKDRMRKQATRQELAGLYQKLGAEHLAQVDPDNPFGGDNIWLPIQDEDPDIWLDYTPAMPHKGKMWPIYEFPFHYKYQERFNRVPTFDKLHTNMLRRTIRWETYRFSLEDQRVLEDLMTLYDDHWEKHEEWLARDPKELYIEDLLTRKVISPHYAEKLRGSEKEYKTFRTAQQVDLGLEAVWEMLKNSPLNVADKDGFIRTFPKLFTDAEFAAKKTFLRGVHKAHDKGVLSDAELQDIHDAIPPQDLGKYVNLQLYQIAYSLGTDAVTIPLLVTAALSPEPVKALIAVGIFNRWGPGVFRMLSTMGLAIKERDLGLAAAAIGSVLPTVGNLFVPIRLKFKYGEKVGEISHYNVRGAFAGISGLRQGGGWNSDYERSMYDKVEPGIENTVYVAKQVKKKTAPVIEGIGDMYEKINERVKSVRELLDE